MCLASVSIAENMNTATIINAMPRTVRRWCWASERVIGEAVKAVKRVTVVTVA